MSEIDTEATAQTWADALEEHSRISQETAAFSRDVDRFLSGEEGLREPILEHTSRLIELFVEHFDREEAPGGLFSDILRTLPHHKNRVVALGADHRRFLVELREVQAMLRAEMPADLDTFASVVRALLKELQQHESQENQLVFEAAGGRPFGVGG